MKIGFCTSEEGWGGSEYYLILLIRGLLERGHQCEIFGVGGSRLEAESHALGCCFIPWKNLDAGAAAEQAVDGSTKGQSTVRSSPSIKKSLKAIYKTLLPRPAKVILGSLQDTIKLYRCIRGRGLDVVHVNASGWEVGGLASFLAGSPSLAVFHSTPLDSVDALDLLLARFYMRWVTRISSVSEYTYNAWCDVLGIRRAPDSYVWNGVPDLRQKEHQRTPRADKNDQVRLIALGRLAPMKGFSYLISAIKLLDRYNIRLEIVGSGEERDRLTRDIASADLNGRVEMVGHVDDVGKRLALSDVLVLPSIFGEACPLVLLEAFSLGVPCITSDFGALPEINLNEYTGLVVPMRDPVALAAAIGRLVDDRALYEALSRGARVRYEAEFSVDTMVQRLIDIYVDMVR